MTDRTATPQGDRPPIEPALTDHNPVQQICEWIMAHKLEGHRVLQRFRLEELGLSDLISSPESDRSQRQGRPD